VNREAWAGITHEGKCTNTDPARRTWKFENGFITLKSCTRQLYVDSNAEASTDMQGFFGNTEDARRKWTVDTLKKTDMFSRIFEKIQRKRDEPQNRTGGTELKNIQSTQRKLLIYRAFPDVELKEDFTWTLPENVTN
jgi:hypothetical protein